MSGFKNYLVQRGAIFSRSRLQGVKVERAEKMLLCCSALQNTCQ